jgi:UDP-2,4-diacetamido-2,4,6-trideoxy-beta-L-altropyranose hydrolase
VSNSSSVNYPSDITIRRVKVEDSRLLLAWRNDPEARMWSRNDGEISLAEHQRWLEDWLSSNQSKGYFFLIEVSGVAAGMIRFDKSGIDTFEISVLVDPKFQNRGVAQNAINLATSEVLEGNYRFKVIASVHFKNLASIKLFNRLEYRDDGLSGDFLKFRREFIFKDIN